MAGGAIADAGIEPTEVDALLVGTLNSSFSKQDFAASLAMQSVSEFRFKPAARCENACASGSAALFAARYFLAVADRRFALVIVVETMNGTTGVKVVRPSAEYRETLYESSRLFKVGYPAGWISKAPRLCRRSHPKGKV